jgi:hypothetical protein
MLLTTHHIYIQIRNNHISVRDTVSKKVCESTSMDPFSTERLLIGNFTVAEALLRSLIRQLVPKQKRFWSLPPLVVIHPMEKCEGGLCQIEERILMELALGSGARKVKLHVGAPLSDLEVVQLFK